MVLSKASSLYSFLLFSSIIMLVANDCIIATHCIDVREGGQGEQISATSLAIFQPQSDINYPGRYEALCYNYIRPAVDPKKHAIVFVFLQFWHLYSASSLVCHFFVWTKKVTD